MKSTLLYSSIFFSLAICLSAHARDFDFDELSEGQTYQLDGPLNVEVVCTLKDGDEVLRQTNSQLTLVPLSGTTNLSSNEYSVDSVKLTGKSVSGNALYSTYTLSFDVPGFDASEDKAKCQVTYSFTKLTKSRELPTQALR